MTKHRSHSIEFKRKGAQEFSGGETQPSVDCSRAAGVTQSPHGLRKAAGQTRGTVTGHRTLSEVQRYTAAVQQENMARTAVGLMSGKPEPQK